MKKDKRLIDSEEMIIEASISTLLANPSAGMSEIASCAGVGRTTLYRHYETREVLIRKLALVCLEEIDTAFQPYEHLRGREALENAFDVLMPLADRFRFLMSLWENAAEDKEIKQICEQQLQEIYLLIEQGKKAGEINKKLSTTWLVAFFDSTITAAWYLVGAGELRAKEAVSNAKLSFFQGCTRR